jgi:hypothetical protein
MTTHPGKARTAYQNAKRAGRPTLIHPMKSSKTQPLTTMSVTTIQRSAASLAGVQLARNLRQRTGPSSDPLSPGMSMLGYGFHIFDQLSSPADSTTCLIDTSHYLDDDGEQQDAGDQTVEIAGVSYRYPGDDLLVMQPDGQTHQSVATGSTYQELVKSVSASASVSGVYGAFSGSLDTEYNTTTRSCSEIKYEIRSALRVLYYMELIPNRYCLTSNVQTALDALDCSDADAVSKFFETYGTHVIIGLQLGGECTYAMHSLQTETITTTDFSADAELAFSFVTGQTSLTTEVEEALKHISCDTDLQVFGGDPSLLLADEPDWSGWISSVVDAPTVVAVTDGADDPYNEKGFKPIWEFCSKTDQATALETMFYQLYSVTRRPLSERRNTTGKGTGDLSDNNRFVTTDANEIIVGFAGNVSGSGSKHFNRFAYNIEDLETGTRYWRAFQSDGTEVTYASGDFQCSGSVLEGYAMTGAALYSNCRKLNCMRLYMQEIRPDQPENHCLSTAVEYIDHPSDNSKVKWDVDWNPSEQQDKQYVLHGFGASESSEDGGYVSKLELTQSLLKPTSDTRTWKRSGSDLVTSTDGPGTVPDEQIYHLDSTNQIIVGFGGTVSNSTKHFSRYAYCVEDLTTAKRTWVARKVDGTDEDFDESNYESICEVPLGYAMTGMALYSNCRNLNCIRLYTQQIDLKADDAHFLSTEIEVCDSSGNLDDVKWDVDWNPSEHTDVAQYVISGVGASESSGQGGYVNALQLTQDRLVAVD